ncbi:hypothetical protein ACFL4O_02025 [bacterium]
MINFFYAFLITVLLLSTALYGQESPLTQYWYTYDGAMTGARAIGMGGAFTAITDSAESVYWNPAGLVFVQNTQLCFMFDMGKESNAKTSKINEHKPIDRGSLLFTGIAGKEGSVSCRPLSRYTKINEQGDETELVINQYTISSASQSDENTFFGMNLNYFKGYLGSLINDSKEMNLSHGAGWGIDWGFIFIKDPAFSLGVLLQNAPAYMYWRDYKNDKIPFVLRVGTGSRFNGAGILSLEYERRYYKGTDDLQVYHMGIEQYMSNSMVLRMGAYGTTLTKQDKVTYTMGLGFRRLKYNVDIAVEQYKLSIDKDLEVVYEMVSSITINF